MADLGQTLIEQVHRKLQVDEEWTTRTDRAFSWIAHRLEQTAFTPRAIHDGEFMLFKLCAETAVVDSVNAPEATVDHIPSNLNRYSFGSCYTFGPSERRIYATTSTWVHQDQYESRALADGDVSEWWSMITSQEFTTSCLIQLAQAWVGAIYQVRRTRPEPVEPFELARDFLEFHQRYLWPERWDSAFLREQLGLRD